MCIARISTPGALYDASISAQNCDALGQVVLKPIYLEDVFGLNIAKSVKNIKFGHIKGRDAFWRKPKKLRTELIT